MHVPGEGASVGEVALTDETSTIRTASVVVETKTDLMIVDKPLYDRSVKETLAKEFEDKRQFILNNPLFASWAPKYRKQLTMALYKETYAYDSVLVKQGDDVEFVYFILRWVFWHSGPVVLVSLAFRTCSVGQLVRYSVPVVLVSLAFRICSVGQLVRHSVSVALVSWSGILYL